MKNNQQPNIDWEPLKSGGASFKTHKLVEVSTLRVEYKASIGSIVFDKSLGYFWKGKKSPREAIDISDIKSDIKVVAKMADIYGIQVIRRTRKKQ